MAGWLTLKCPTCGGRLKFNKSDQVFTCEHCGNLHLLEDGGQPPPAFYRLPRQEWMRAGDYEIIVHEVVDAQVEDQRVIYINVEYANHRSRKPLSCRYNQWLLFDQLNYSYEASSSDRALYEDQQRPFLGHERFLNRGMQARGWLAFEVPDKTRLKRLHFFTGFLQTHTVDILLDNLERL